MIFAQAAWSDMRFSRHTWVIYCTLNTVEQSKATCLVEWWEMEFLPSLIEFYEIIFKSKSIQKIHQFEWTCSQLHPGRRLMWPQIRDICAFLGSGLVAEPIPKMTQMTLIWVRVLPWVYRGRATSKGKKPSIVYLEPCCRVLIGMKNPMDGVRAFENCPFIPQKFFFHSTGKIKNGSLIGENPPNKGP